MSFQTSCICRSASTPPVLWHPYYEILRVSSRLLGGISSSQPGPDPAAAPFRVLAGPALHISIRQPELPLFAAGLPFSVAFIYRPPPLRSHSFYFHPNNLIQVSLLEIAAVVDCTGRLPHTKASLVSRRCEARTNMSSTSPCASRPRNEGAGQTETPRARP